MKRFIRSTAGEPPWSIGITENHNAILRNLVSKLLLDDSNKYLIEIIVVWTVSTKNTLHNCYRYSPNQLVFRKNPSFPSVFTDNLPVSTEIIPNHLNAMNAP